MTILVLTPYLYGTTAGPRSGIELWERILRPEGIEFEYSAFENQALHDLIYERGRFLPKCREILKACGRRARTTRTLDDFDAVIVNREAALIGPAIVERVVARKGIPIIYQLDDPLYVPYRSPYNGYLSYLKFFGKVATICRLSQVVIANSRHHVEYASQYNANVRQIPSLVDGEEYVYRPNAASGRSVCVGWSGSPSTAANLKTIEGVLEELGARDDLDLHFIGAESFDLPRVRYSSQVWNATTEVDDLRRIDIGLVPLPRDEWTRRKFYLKLIQYMALGIPAVCTPLGSNPDVIEHGVTGFLAETPSEWRDAIDRLVASPDLRADMGRRAAEVAHRKYTLDANKDHVVQAFRSALR